ncbi:hypothetical protein PUMCH_002682 [Australozyma saopauloensis]|uniref:VPS37 C-terminal domain-containing protein n=1 Tax=Australozyma saopauloensis TaxID=291208 RepID=A0AAX4H9Y0_9ASCO|nr:hypothetical protein PUMCH_002682 [[Candida] saopauloensis]
MSTLQPLNINQLQPFPLLKELSALPSHLLNQFAALYELTKGYVVSLDTYGSHQQDIVNRINENVDLLNRILELISDYNACSQQISRLAQRLELLYRQFLELETAQYQLLSSNYNTNVLKSKFERFARGSDATSSSMAKSYATTGAERDLLQFLREFKDSRKEYHMQREKLNRWEEERVSGLF